AVVYWDGSEGWGRVTAKQVAGAGEREEPETGGGGEKRAIADGRAISRGGQLGTVPCYMAGAAPFGRPARPATAGSWAGTARRVRGEGTSAGGLWRCVALMLGDRRRGCPGGEKRQYQATVSPQPIGWSLRAERAGKRRGHVRREAVISQRSGRPAGATPSI